MQVCASMAALLFMSAELPAQTATELPEAPSAMLMAAASPAEFRMAGQKPSADTETVPRRCPLLYFGWKQPASSRASEQCEENPLQMVVETSKVPPLTPTQKAELAGRNLIDPFNIVTITGYSAIYVGAQSHSPYGPGFKGWGRLVGYSFAEDAQGEFFGVYAIPSLAHEDPRYHRLPGRPVKTRLLHAIVHTVVAQHDNGTLMPNYAVLLTYPISAELSNAYVPGISTSGSATRDRILLGYGTNPIGDLVSEFLPDVAKRVHVRVVFVQQILNKIAARGTTSQ